MKAHLHFLIVPDRFYNTDQEDIVNPLSEELNFIAFHQTAGRYLFNPTTDSNVANKVATFGLYVPKKYGSFNNDKITNRKLKSNNEKIVLIEHDNYSINRAVKVADVIAHSKHVKLNEFLYELVKYDEINDDDYILFKRTAVPSWQDSIPSNLQRNASGYFWEPEKEAIHIAELIRTFSNVEITYDKYYKLKQLLEQKDSFELGLQLLNECNIVKNPIETMLLLNRCKLQTSNNNKIYKKNAKLKEIFPQMVWGLNVIQRTAETLLNRKLNAEEKEFIADEYHSDNIEESDLFKFKLKVK